MSKEDLRNKMKAKRRALTAAERAELSEKIFNKLSQMKEYKNANSVCVYMDFFAR